MAKNIERTANVYEGIFSVIPLLFTAVVGIILLARRLDHNRYARVPLAAQSPQEQQARAQHRGDDLVDRSSGSSYGRGIIAGGIVEVRSESETRSGVASFSIC
jgi:hypothetical protein